MKTLLKIGKVLCYFCSFPLFIICACIASSTNIEMGGSYGFLTYLSIVFPVIFGLIWAIIVIVHEAKIKKNTVNKIKKIRKQTAKQVIASLFLCCGLMFALDGALPIIFPDLSSGTIFYEDLAETKSANNRAKLNKNLLDVVTSRSIMTGIIGDHDGDGYTQYYTKNKTQDIGDRPYTGYEVNITGGVKTPVVMCKYGYYVTVDSFDFETGIGTERLNPTARTEEEIKTMDEYFSKLIKHYCDQGMANEEVASLVTRDGKNNLFAGINLSGYESWIGPWVDFANDNRMTVPVIVNLIMGNRQSIVSDGAPGTDGYANPKGNEDSTRERQTALHPYPWYNPATGKVQQIQLGWSVLDMLGDGIQPTNPEPSMPLDLSSTFGEEGLFGMLKNLEVAGIPLGELLGTLGAVHLDADGNLLGLKIPSIYYLVDSLLASISYATGDPAIAGTPAFTPEDDSTNSGWMYGFAPLTLRLVNGDGSYGVQATTQGNKVYLDNIGANANQLGIYSTNFDRGTLDYMKYAWVDANGLIFAITGLFAIRKLSYVFAAITILLSMVIGAIRIKLVKMEQGNAPVEDNNDDDNQENDDVQQDEQYEENEQTEYPSYETPYDDGTQYEMPYNN